MKIYFERNNETQDLKIEQEMVLKDVLKMFGIVNESVILVKNENICLEDSKVCNDDKIKVLSVVSGG